MVSGALLLNPATTCLPDLGWTNQVPSQVATVPSQVTSANAAARLLEVTTVGRTRPVTESPCLTGSLPKDLGAFYFQTKDKRSTKPGLSSDPPLKA